MSIKLHSLVALGAAVLLATSALAGQAKPATPATPAQGAPAAPAKFVAPIRGEAQVSMTKPLTKRTATEIITNFKVKNPSTTGSVSYTHLTLPTNREV